MSLILYNIRNQRFEKFYLKEFSICQMLMRGNLPLIPIFLTIQLSWPIFFPTTTNCYNISMLLLCFLAATLRKILSISFQLQKKMDVSFCFTMKRVSSEISDLISIINNSISHFQNILLSNSSFIFFIQLLKIAAVYQKIYSILLQMI